MFARGSVTRAWTWCDAGRILRSGRDPVAHAGAVGMSEAYVGEDPGGGVTMVLLVGVVLLSAATAGIIHDGD